MLDGFGGFQNVSGAARQRLELLEGDPAVLEGLRSAISRQDLPVLLRGSFQEQLRELLPQPRPETLVR